jgi:hypothetical protein
MHGVGAKKQEEFIETDDQRQRGQQWEELAGNYVWRDAEDQTWPSPFRD